MSRLPYAAKTLIHQVVTRFPDAQVTQSEPDGLNVSRTIGFEGDAAQWLAPLLAAAADQRIASHDLSESGLSVTFANSIKADEAAPFLLPEVEAILAEPTDENKFEVVFEASGAVGQGTAPDESSVTELEDEPAAKKRAPRKKTSD